MAVSRRQALGAALAVGVAGCMPAAARRLFASAATSRDGEHWLVAFDAHGEVAWRTPLPGRGHEIATAPDGRTAFAPARRPGDWAAVVDLRDGRVAHLLRAAPGRHFYGHAVFSPDGERILTTENDFARGRGVIVVRSARTLDVLGEFPSGGVGPHEAKWLHSGLLAVANGGIRTHPEQPRKKLNLNEMRPNLALVDTLAGTVAERVTPPRHQASIRHLDVAGGRVVLAMQYEGSPTDDVPLLLVFDARRGALRPLPAPLDIQRRMRQYVASVRVDAPRNRAMATAPRGHLTTYWDLDRGYLGHRRMRDAGGVALDPRAGRFLVTNGSGAVARFDAATGLRSESMRVPGLRWDNHLTAV